MLVAGGQLDLFDAVIVGLERLLVDRRLWEKENYPALESGEAKSKFGEGILIQRIIVGLTFISIGD